MRARAPAVLAALAVALAGCGGGDEDEAASPLQTETEAAAVEEEPIAIPLTAIGDSGQTGEATLSPAEEQGTLVVVTLDQGDEEPVEAHLHRGTCAELRDDTAVAHELEPVGQEPSETSLDASVEELITGGYALAVHDADGAHAACGDVAGPAD